VPFDTTVAIEETAKNHKISLLDPCYTQQSCMHAYMVFALGFWIIIIIINLGSRLKLGYDEHRKLKVEGSLPETLLVREPDSAASAAEFKSVKLMTG
jgi:hypothetical protein